VTVGRSVIKWTAVQTVVGIGPAFQKERGDFGPAVLGRIGKRADFTSADVRWRQRLHRLVDFVGTVLRQHHEAAQFLFLIRIGGNCGHGRRRVYGFLHAQCGEILAAETGLGVNVRKLSDEPLVKFDGVGLAVLLSAHFGEPEQGRGGGLTLLVPFAKESFVTRRGFGEVAGGLLFKQSIAEKAVKFPLRGRRWIGSVQVTSQQCDTGADTEDVRDAK
jgi:hypothetical protein